MMSARVGSSFAVLLLVGSLAHAQPTPASQASTAAGALFDQGRQLAAAGKYAQACAAFDQSQRLDPQLGTLYNLANCNIHLGKLATAWGALRDIAQRDTNKARRAKAASEAADLAPRVPRLVIRLAPAVPDATVTSNGVDVGALLGVESPVDLGDYAIVARAPGYAESHVTAHVSEEGKTVEIAIALARPAGEPPPLPAPSAPPPATPPAAATELFSEPAVRVVAPSGRRTAGTAALAGGGALLASGLVFGALASSQWNAAKAACGSDVDCADTAALARAQSATQKARTRGDVSTVLVVSGLAAAGVGAYLWLHTPSSPNAASAWLVPQASPASAGAAIEGRF